ncbi:MAG: hypothetical protein JRJ62_13290 [Deltaproteobacteria bacterium]|nr:hypothetical protein [Deltaproteobacteria bacterium]
MNKELSEKLSHLPGKSRNAIVDFTGKLAKAFDDKLYSFILFGSAAGKNFIEGKSDINTMIILYDVAMSDLEIIMEAGQKYARKGLAVPLVFEKGHVVSSLDTFPIEFSDMKQRHILLHGEDPLKDAVIERKNLRYQCEREFKSMLVNLRRGFLRTEGKRENIEALLEESLSSVLAACRGIPRPSTGSGVCTRASPAPRRCWKLYSRTTRTTSPTWRPWRTGWRGRDFLLFFHLNTWDSLFL